MLAPLTILLFATFIVLWFFDIIFTKKCVSKLGPEVELNPIIRSILSIRGRFIYIVKTIELILYSIIYFYVQNIDEVLALKLILLGVLFYGIVNAVGIKVYISTHNNPTPVIILFITLLIFTIIFAYMAFTEQQNRVLLLDNLKQCYTGGKT